jgi:hypothetical protein
MQLLSSLSSWNMSCTSRQMSWLDSRFYKKDLFPKKLNFIREEEL